MKFKVGDEIICIYDCYDNHGVKLHSVGEINKIFTKIYTGNEWYIKLSDDLKSGSKVMGHDHVVDEEYLIGYFVTTIEYRKMIIDTLLNK